MENIEARKRVFKKRCLGMMASIVLLLFFTGTGFAANFVAIKVFPEHVGVFTTDGKQQFVAFGIDANGEYINITDQVTWEITKEIKWVNGDPVTTKNLVSINENGLATIAAGVKGGQVRVTATYPKSGKATTAPMMLLLKNDQQRR